MKTITILTWIVIGIIIFILFLIRKRLGTLLKDQSTLSGSDKPYSLSKTITFYWTILIFFSICYIAITCNKLPDIGGNVLILMGIALGTGVTGKTIDSTEAADKFIVRMQDNCKSEGFLIDILSDKNGISTSRLQTVFFTLIYGASFLSFAIATASLKEFTPTELGLLGISSGAYALAKTSENKS